MISVALSTFALSAALVAAQTTTPPAGPPAMATYPAVPLASKGPFQYPDGIPYKVDTDTNLIRGVQLGYNVCNETTVGTNSLCQTGWLNGVDDFCLWAPSVTGRTVGDIEGEMIAWCTKETHGARLIPAGAIKGIQFTKTPDYVQVVGFFDQTKLNMIAGDSGGEMDPHGADARGNPMGGIVFSDQFGSRPIQVIEWHNFMGNDVFCFKACDPGRPNARRYCEHIFDRIGCKYNAPSAAQNGTFESCDGESQDFPGIYTSNGQVLTYTQPPESLGAISTMPYEPRIPASSNCVKHESAAIFTDLPAATGVTTTSSPTGSGLTSARPTTGASSASSAGAANPTGGATSQTVALSSAATMFGVAFAALFLA